VNHLGQTAGERIHNRCPIAGGSLPKQTHRRIPGTVIATKQPAPGWHRGKWHPNRTAERASQVCHRRFDGNNKVKVANRCRGLGKIGQKGREVLDRLRRRMVDIAGGRADLKAAPANARDTP